MPYLDYTAGTITLTRGSRSVTGNKTYWLQKIQPQSILRILQTDGETGRALAEFYIVEKVISDTQLLLTESYAGDNLETKYVIQRQPEQYLNQELATQQMKILDKISGLDTAVDSAEENASKAEMFANAAQQYAAEAEASMNTAIEQATIATEKAEIATEQATIATEQAQIATEQAGISTEQAGVSTEQANIAVETVQNFINNSNRPGGAVIVGEDGKIVESLIPGSVKDVKSYPSISEFPPTGEIGFLYLAIDTQKVYLWSGSPANMYVPVDTQLSLEGTGTAQTAARSDHHHDGIYEPAHLEYVWSGVIDTEKNLDTMFIKDGNYLCEATTNIVLEGQSYMVGILVTKSYSPDLSIGGLQLQSAVIVHDDRTIMIANRVISYGIANGVPTITSAPAWKLTFAYDSIRLGGSKYHFVTQEEYDTGTADGSISTDDVAFIEETADKASFAVKSVNGLFPDGAGNIAIDVMGNKTILANPTDYPLYRNANNIKSDGERVMVTVALYGAVENYPVNDATAMFIRCYLAETTRFQDCYVLKSDGSTELWQRFGTTTAWQGWSKVSGGGTGGNTEIKQVVFAGATANDVKVIPIPRNEQYTGLPIEVLKFVQRDGTSVIMGGILDLNNSANFDITDNVEFTDSSATLNNTIIINSTTTDECLIDLSVLSQYEDWRIVGCH